jgi:hypothetical protein
MKYDIVFQVSPVSGWVIILQCGKNKYSGETRYSSYDSASRAAKRTGAKKLEKTL